MPPIDDIPAGDTALTPDADPLERCQNKIGYRFRDVDLLRNALTHASGADHRLSSNERLEFLGDAILGANVCEILYQRYPSYLEGDLTRIKSIVVSRQTCARISRKLGLEDDLIVGKGMTGSRYPSSVLSDVLEALIAAVFLDGGSEAARNFIHRHVVPEIDEAEEGLGENYKSQLQQLTQREYGSTPTYHLIDEQGPDHSKCFCIAARVSGQQFAPAWGRNKKEAEQRAAANALCQMNDEPPLYDMGTGG
ncbi:MAG: ribonuclease III [Planctomycetales bacterium]|nr:ribonuclease III [Planctomycetales bacterium]